MHNTNAKLLQIKTKNNHILIIKKYEYEIL